MPRITLREKARTAATVTLTAGLAAVTVAACGSSSSGSAADGGGSSSRLTVSCYPATPGTAWYDLWNKYIEPGFQAKYHAKIVYNQGNSADTIARMQAQKGNPSIDVACLDTGPSAQASDLGLLAPLDPSLVPNLARVTPAFKQPGNKGVAISSLIAGIAYNTKEYAAHGIAPPTDWNAFLDPKVKGHIVITTFDNTLGIVMTVGLAQQAGGSIANVEPGFKAARQVAEGSVASTKIDDISSNMESQGAWLGMWTNAEEATFEKTGFPVKFVYPKSGGVLIGQTLDVVQGAPHAKLAQQLVNYVLSPEIQKVIATKADLTPAVSNIKLSPALKQRLGIGQKVVSLDWATINKNRQAWTQEFNQKVLSALG